MRKIKPAGVVWKPSHAGNRGSSPRGTTIKVQGVRYHFRSSFSYLQESLPTLFPTRQFFLSIRAKSPILPSRKADPRRVHQLIPRGENRFVSLRSLSEVHDAGPIPVSYSSLQESQIFLCRFVTDLDNEIDVRPIIAFMRPVQGIQVQV